MIRFEEAQQFILQAGCDPAVEKVNLPEALNRVLAEDVEADMDMPPFDKSAMDGFACRREDLGQSLLEKATIAAGQSSDVTVSEGECARIMTGARVPKGADCVIKFEDTETVDEGLIRFTAEKTSTNICYLGEDVRTGDTILKRGTRLEPRHVAVLAGMGYAHPKVYVRPAIGIFVTGDELVDVTEKPSGTRIRNSNGPQLEAQCLAMNLKVQNYGIIPDSVEVLTKAVSVSAEENSVTIISGGVSMGDFDYIPTIVKEAGFNIHFHGMKVKPGKRMLFASRKGKYIFGLPGNPVSAMVQFEMLVKPLLLRLQGASELPDMHNFRIKSEYWIKNTERTSFVPVIINNDGTVDPVEYHGSAHIFAYTKANGFMEIPEGISYISKGQIINARRL